MTLLCLDFTRSAYISVQWTP